MYKFYKIALLITFGLFASCATYNMQVDSAKAIQSDTSNKTLSHTFYLVGDAGYQKELDDKSQVLLELKNKLESESENASILFLGDNVYPNGLPKKKDPNYASSIASLQTQIDVADNFKGRTLFIPGNHDWYSEDGLQGLKRQEKFIEGQLKKFLHSCLITVVLLIRLILVMTLF